MKSARLSVVSLLVGAGESFLAHRAAFLRLFWLPWAVFVVQDAATLAAAEGGATLQLVARQATLLAAVAVVPALTGWHRVVIGGGQPRLVFGRAEFRYAILALGYSYFIAAGGAAAFLAVTFALPELLPPEVPLSASAHVLTAAGVAVTVMVALLIATARWFLVFPDAALGQRMKLSAAAAESRGNGAVLFAATLLPLLPVALLHRGFDALGALAGAPILVTAAIADAAAMPFLAVSVSVLSLAYRMLHTADRGAEGE